MGKTHSHTSLFLLVTSPKVHMKPRLGNQLNPDQGRGLVMVSIPFPLKLNWKIDCNDSIEG